MASEQAPLDTCGCCEDSVTGTPLAVNNGPGQSALAYRVGTFHAFRSAMHRALSRASSLQGLTTREDRDPTIGLLDAWSTVLDVLTFYQERLANEGFLRTAVERRSLLELARAIGYELHPGVAAGTNLVFFLDDLEGAPSRVTIPTGIKVQSIPGQDESPQTFETVESCESRVAWNRLYPQRFQTVPPKVGLRNLFIRGTTADLKPGDGLLLVGDERDKDPGNEQWDFRRIKSLRIVPPSVPSADPQAGYTEILLDRALGSVQPYVTPSQQNPQLYVLRQRAGLFGHHAPDWKAMSEEIKVSYGDTNLELNDWPRFNIAYRNEVPKSLNKLYLDALYPKIVKGSWLVVSSPDYQELYTVSEATETSRTNFTLTGKCTQVTVKGENLAEIFFDQLREVVIYAQNERLELAEVPITDPIEGDRVMVDRVVEDLPSGRVICLVGMDRESGEVVSEMLTLERTLMVDQVRTLLVFTSAMEHAYDRESVVLHANVVRATHGESTTEILGSGDTTQTFQTFQLKQRPLTTVSAATPSGSASTLEIRVNKLLWEEVPSFHGVGPTEHVFTTRLADDGTVTVQFGDGQTGARLPTGTENVTATYRVGTGLEGQVQANQISLLLTRPLGVSSAVNPLPAAGAADRETLEEARQNAPLTVLTLDRIVSVQDYEDFTRSFAGIGKAQASLLWSGQQQSIHLTVAGADGDAVAETSDLYRNLREAIDRVRQRHVPVLIDSFIPLTFQIRAKVFVDETYVADEVIASAESLLAEAFSFSMRAFAQAVTKSEVLAIIQGGPGVIAVDLDALSITGEPSQLQTVLPARRAAWDQGEIRPAELLTLLDGGVHFSVGF